MVVAPRRVQLILLTSLPNTSAQRKRRLKSQELSLKLLCGMFQTQGGHQHQKQGLSVPGTSRKQELRAGTPDMQPLPACSCSCLMGNIFRMIPVPGWSWCRDSIEGTSSPCRGVFWITAWCYIGYLPYYWAPRGLCCSVLLDSIRQPCWNSLVWTKPVSVLPFKLIDVELGHAIHGAEMKTFLPPSGL